MSSEPTGGGTVHLQGGKALVYLSEFGAHRGNVLGDHRGLHPAAQAGGRLLGLASAAALAARVGNQAGGADHAKGLVVLVAMDIDGQIKAFLAEEQGPEELHYAGLTYTRRIINATMKRDLKLFVPLTVGLIMFVLFLREAFPTEVVAIAGAWVDFDHPSKAFW